MENVQFVADNEKWLNKRDFSGLKVLKVEDDVLSMEFADGRSFSAPINDLQIRRTTGWRLLLQSPQLRSYKFYTNDGRVFKLGGLYLTKDFSGFVKPLDGLKSLLNANETVEAIYAVLDSMPNTKDSGLEIFEKIISWGGIAFIILCIIIGIIPD